VEAVQANLDSGKLVFIDETGTDTKMVRTRADATAADS
jgi:hypothetical protein